MKIKEKIKEKLISFSYILAGFIIGAIISVTLSYGAGNQGLIGSAFECLSGSNCSQLVLQSTAFADKTIALSKLTQSLQDLINGKANSSDVVAKNTAITGNTKTKITYDSKGLVTSGTGLLESDIPNLSANKINAGTLTNGMMATTLGYPDGSTKLATTKYVDNGLTALSTTLGASSSIKYSYFVTTWYECSGSSLVQTGSCMNLAGLSLTKYTPSCSCNYVNVGFARGWRLNCSTDNIALCLYQ